MRVTSFVQDTASPEDRAHNPKTILAHYRELAPKDIHKAFERINRELTPEEKDELLCLMLFFIVNEVRKIGEFCQAINLGMLAAAAAEAEEDEDTDSNPSSKSN